jgi:superfamily II DNA helicase RecQ
MLSTASQQKLTELQHQLDGWLIIQLLVEWSGYPTKSSLSQSFFTLTQRPLAEVVLSTAQQLGYLTMDTHENIHLTLAGLNALKNIQPLLYVWEQPTPQPQQHPTSSGKKTVSPPETEPSASTVLLPIPTEESLSEDHWRFYERLLEARYHFAEKAHTKPASICSNALLRSLAVYQPTDYAALEQLEGVSGNFIKKFGATVISLTTANLLQ